MRYEENKSLLTRVDIEEHINIDEEIVSSEAFTLKVCVDENKIFTDFSKADLLKGYSDKALILTDVNLARFTYQYIQGANSDDLAKSFKISKALVNSIKCLPQFKRMLTLITAEVTYSAKMFLNTAGLKATRTIVELLDSDDEKVRFSAAKDILDRMGVKNAAAGSVESGKKDDLSHMNEEQLKEILKLGVKELLAENKGD